LNPRHYKLPQELQEALFTTKEISFEAFLRHRDIYSGSQIRVHDLCEVCGADWSIVFKKLKRRTRTQDENLCSVCALRRAVTSDGWRAANSAAQKIAQNRPDMIEANRARGQELWKDENRLASMKEKVLAAQQRPETKAKYIMRDAWNGRGIAGELLSKWGWLRFDSSYELAFLTAAELRDDISLICRGPTLAYKDEAGTERLYVIDFRVEFVSGVTWWVEVKSGYIGKHRERLDRLRSKLTAAAIAAQENDIARVLLLHENNSMSEFGFEMPRSSYRTALFKLNAHRIIFARAKDTAKYG
jgi:hypothetical protein